MKTITKISLIGGLLASSMALAAPSPDTDSKKASQECHHGAHSRMMGQGVDGEGISWIGWRTPLSLLPNSVHPLKRFCKNRNLKWRI